MFLTHCAACAAPLGLTLGKKCGRCSTRYCGAACQAQHWKEGGHDTLCKKIKKTGGAEQYNANEKYTEAVAVAAEACADDTKGQTCFICTQALHWKTKEGLVRGCSCRGTAGFAHVSCLVEQAKILVAEAVENNLDSKVKTERFRRWHACGLCEQEYHGVVACALGWACWKTYVGRPEGDANWDAARIMAMNQLGNGLHAGEHYEQALSVKEAELLMLRRVGDSERNILIVQGNLAGAYEMVGREEDALRARRDVYFGLLRLNGELDPDTLREANNFADSLCCRDHLDEAKLLLRKTIPLARRVLGEGSEVTLRMRRNYARTLSSGGDTLDDLSEAVDTLEDVERIARRVLGDAHPFIESLGILPQVRAALTTKRRNIFLEGCGFGPG